jgi:hypothetical protein
VLRRSSRHVVEETRLRQVVREQVDVGREREGGGVVPEPHLYLLRVQAAAKEQLAVSREVKSLRPFEFSGICFLVSPVGPRSPRALLSRLVLLYDLTKPIPKRPYYTDIYVVRKDGKRIPDVQARPKPKRR